MKNHPDHVKNSQIPPATSGLAWDEIRYVYDPLGRRIYDGWNVVEERTERQGAPGISKFLFWGEDLSGSLQGAGGVGGLLTQMEKTDTTNWSASYYHYDGNGNVATVSGPFRAILAKFSYDGFGRTVTQTGAKSGIDINAIPYRFSTKPMELELATSNTTLVPPPVSSGLYYYGYRFYSPNLGRWINRDPIREEGGLNLYGMVGNDAENKLDKLGLILFELDATILPPDTASGRKVYASVDVSYNPCTKKYSVGTPNKEIGDTYLISGGGSQDVVVNTFSNGNIFISFTGDVFSRLYPMNWISDRHINWNISLYANVNKDLPVIYGTVDASHDGYPTYTLKGGGVQLYYSLQTTIDKLEPPDDDVKASKAFVFPNH